MAGLISLGLPDVKASAYNAGDPGSISGSGRSPGEGNGNLLQTLKRLPTTWETRVQSLGQEDLLEKEVATHPRSLTGYSPWGHREWDTTE